MLHPLPYSRASPLKKSPIRPRTRKENAFIPSRWLPKHLLPFPPILSITMRVYQTHARFFNYKNRAYFTGDSASRSVSLQKDCISFLTKKPIFSPRALNLRNYFTFTRLRVYIYMKEARKSRFGFNNRRADTAKSSNVRGVFFSRSHELNGATSACTQSPMWIPHQ